jgi:23S rRNA pseudouridine1911/1915/1917 synthase
MTLRTRWRPSDRFLVRHKDAAVLVVEKKAGVLSQRTESGRGEDMLTLLRAFVGGKGRSPGVLPVHRLDRNVSGLLVYARRADVQQDLIAQFAEHSVDRIYIAAVRGVLAADRGTFDTPLVTDDRSLVVYSDPERKKSTARRAVTHWRVLERFTASKATLVEVRLETGLRNQIRVHFADAGHPLLGERKYRPDEEGESQGAQRIFLHAAVLGFEHPLTHQRMRFEAPLPPELVRWKKSLAVRSPAEGDPQPRGPRPRRRHRRLKNR